MNGKAKTINIRLCFNGQVFHILFIAGDSLLQPSDFLRKFFEDLILQTILLAEMVGFQQFQPPHINVQVMR